SRAHRPGRGAATVRAGRRRGSAARQLPRAGALLRRRPAVRRGRAAARREAATDRAHRAIRRRAAARASRQGAAGVMSGAPEPLELRAPPTPVRRLNRKALLAAAAGLSMLVGASLAVALAPPRARDEAAPQELYSIRNVPRADR